MIVWLNGTFGVGKLTTASLLAQRVEHSRVFDPEHVGDMLSSNFSDVAFADFQELPPWRELVPNALKSVREFTGATVIAPQTVLVEEYWNELRDRMVGHGLDVRHVLLDCGEDTLRQRIENDTAQGPSAWRRDHVASYLRARPWLLDQADLVIDATDRGPDAVVDAIIQALNLVS